MEPDIYKALAQRGSDWSRLVGDLNRIEQAVNSIQFGPFFEPVSVLDDFGPSAEVRV